MRRLLKWTAWGGAAPLLLLSMTILLLYLPPVQDYAVRRAAAYASEQTGMHIAVERLRLTPILDVALDRLTVTDSVGDTLVAARRATVDLSLRQIFQKRVKVEGIALTDVQLDTKEMITSVVVQGHLQQLHLHDDIDLTCLHLAVEDLSARGVDVTITLIDTTVVDTTESEPLAWTLAVARATLSDARVRLVNDTTQLLDLDSLGLQADSIFLDLGQQHLRVPQALLVTPSSSIQVWTEMDFSAFTPGSDGRIDVGIHTTFSKMDLLRVAGNYLPNGFARAYPDAPLHVELTASGNIEHLTLTRAEATLPGSIYLDAQGDVAHLLDSTALQGQMAFNLQTKNINWVRALAGGALDGVALPPMQLIGMATADGPQYGVNATLTEGGGLAYLKGNINTRAAMSYNATLDVSRLQLCHFLPSLAIDPLTAEATVQGNGTDLLNPSSRLDASVVIRQLTYDTYNFDGTTLEAHLARGRGHASLRADNATLRMQADVDALLACEMNGNTVDAELKEMIHVIGENMKIQRFQRVELADGQRGMVMDIQPDRVGCIIFGGYDHVDSYSSVRRLDTMASVPVGEAMLGRVVDALGVPIDGKGRASSPGYEVRDWANVAFLDRMFSPVMDDLLAQYHRDDALKVYCCALLRVAYPGIKDHELKEAYDSSFLSILRPGAALSENVVSDLLFDLGRKYSRIADFMSARADSLSADARLLIDGTLKSDESRVNSLSDFSRKAATKGTKDIPVIYCFDLESGEPVCSQCYPGNMLDVTAYSDFIGRNGIRRGLIVADKGFPSDAASAHFEANPDLHYLNPVKRNSRLIQTHSMLSFGGVLPGHPTIRFKKARVSGKAKWLYSFRDSDKAAKEEADFLSRAAKADAYDNPEYLRRRDSFGVVVFECDLDWDPGDIYFAYTQRWRIETVMRYYKNSLELDETRVHGDLSVIGSEFVDFLASLLTFKVINFLDSRKILEKMAYGKVMKKLTRGKKVLIKGEWKPVKVNPSTEGIYRELEILPPLPEKEKGPRGRPRKPAI